jgi:hypothetical protein
LRESEDPILVDDGTTTPRTRNGGVTMNEGAGLKACLNTRVSGIHQNKSILFCFVTVDIRHHRLGREKEGMTTAKTKSWALRLPMNLQLKDLDGCTFDSDEKCLVIQGVSYQLVPSSSTTETAVCALEPQKKRDDDSSGSDDDDDDDDDDESSSGSSKKKKTKKGDKQNKKKKEAKTVKLVATPTESYSLIETNLDASDAMLRTTSIDTSTVPDTILRKAYRHVPQVAGLKRRWMPMGNRIGNWQPLPVTVSNQDDVADAAAGAVVPLQEREHYPVDIQPEIKAEPRDEPNEAVAGKKRDRSSSTSKKAKKDKSAKKTKRKKTT